ncbi:MAG TPA: hypothetical protein GXX36_15990 [Clostridiaceae bacterium]|nr:hypothetical protein [Clostridiaceae bacterium]
MKRIKRILVTGCLVIVLLIAEIIIIRNVSGYHSKVEVVFTKTAIPEGTVIEENMLEIKEVDMAIVPKNAVKHVKEVVGKETGTNMDEREMVVTGRLREAGESDEIKVVNEGNRLFSVEFKSDQVNGWQLSAGQYVDIIFIPNDNTNLQTDNIGSQTDNKEEDKDLNKGGEDPTNNLTNNIESLEYSNSCPGVQILKNIRIAAIIDEKGELLKGNDITGTPRIISFEVSERQDHFLAWAKSHGRLEVSLIQKEKQFKE